MCAFAILSRAVQVNKQNCKTINNLNLHQNWRGGVSEMFLNWLIILVRSHIQLTIIEGSLDF